MELDPMELIDRLVLFAPQLYDWREIAYLRRTLSEGDVFLDLGCSIGFYALVGSSLVGRSGRVLAIEADSYSYSRLTRTVEENGINNLDVLQIGLSDRNETLALRLQLHGNRGGSSFLAACETDENAVAVGCMPLLDVLDEAGIERVDAAKLDLEGFEPRVLSAFFETAEHCLWPRHLIVERNEELTRVAGRDVNQIVSERGYSLQFRHGDNYVWSLDQA
jgi:FkbM family methyltransferase